MPAPKKAKAAPAEDPRLTAIRAAAQAAEAVRAELQHRAELAITPAEAADIQPDIDRARNAADDCRQKEIDLAASASTMPPADPATVSTLARLAQQIEKAIAGDALFAASVEELASILHSAARINALV